MDYLVAALAFIAVFLLIFGVNYLISGVMAGRREQVRKRLDEELRLRQKQRAQKSIDRKESYNTAADVAGQAQAGSALGEWFTRLVEESGTLMTPAQLAALCLGLALATGLPLGLLWGQWVLAVIAAPVGAVLPVLYISVKRMKRREKLLSQLPDAFELMSRAMKAGQTISQAFQEVAEELSSPTAEEFGYCYDQQNLGLSPEAAMRDLARRTGLLEIRIFVVAVMVHRQTGGNLAELLEKLAGVIRERYRIRGAVKALTAEGRLQAIILLALPPIIFLVMLALNRPYASTLLQYPALLVGMFVFMTIGAVCMHRIVSFDF